MIWFIFVLFDVGTHFFIIEGLELRPRYAYATMWRFAAAACFLFYYHPEFDPLGDPTTIFPAVTYALFQWSSFYLLFDPLLNIAREKPFDYRGEKSGYIDPRLSRKNWWLLKAACLVVMVLAIIVMS